MQPKCTNCDSYKLRKVNSNSVGMLAGVGIMTFGLMIVLFLTWLFPPFFLLGLFVMMIGATIGFLYDMWKGYHYFRCRNCGIRFNLNAK